MKRLWPVLFLLAGCIAVSGAEMTLSFSFNPSQLTLTTQGSYQQVELVDGLMPEDAPGAPWLPARYVNVLLPAGAVALSVKAAAEEIQVADGIDIYPVQPPRPLSVPASAFVPPDPARYASPDRWPAQAAVLGETHHLRGYTFASVRLNPVRYVPAARELYLATNLAITVFYQQTAGDAQIHAAASSADELFADIVSSAVVNPDQVSQAAPAPRAAADQPAAAVDYLIITSASLSNAFQVLASHRRTQNSLNTLVLTTEYIASRYSGARPGGGSDLQTQIRNCIIDYVQNYGLTYVVLGGENTIIPDRDCSVSCSGYIESAMPSDIYYSGLDGNWDSNANGIYGEASTSEGDLAFDVIVARIPVYTPAQVTNYVNKLKKYETAVGPSGFAARTIMGGNNLWTTYSGDSRPSDTIGDGFSEFRSHASTSDAEIWGRRMYRDRMAVYSAGLSLAVFYDTLTSWDSATAGDYLLNGANLQARLNQGWNHVFLGTHGNETAWGVESGGFYSSNATALTNMTTFVYTMACLTGGFDLAEPCLSEAFLRNLTGGALVYMGCSRYGWGSPGSYQGGPSFDYAYRFYQQLFYYKRSTIGRAFAEHKLAMASSSGYNGANRWVQFGMNLQGDPLVSLSRSGSQLGDDPFWFRAVALTNNVFLRWPDPTSCGVPDKTVQIRYRTDRYPTNITDGVLLYTGTAQTYEHTGTTPGQPLYYTIWVSPDGSIFQDPPQ